MSLTKQYRTSGNQYRMTSTRAVERQVEEMTGTVRKHTRLGRGQANEVLHAHHCPARWKYDGPSDIDLRLDVWRCQVRRCQVTMTAPNRYASP